MVVSNLLKKIVVKLQGTLVSKLALGPFLTLKDWVCRISAHIESIVKS